MLSSILKKSDCASCKFCCSFRRQSLWETPLFDSETTEKLRKLYPDVKFRPAGNTFEQADSYTFDISDKYKTSDSEEEVPCPFLNPEKGCVLGPELKPFDCSIWPFRAVNTSLANGSSEISVALTPTCPAINKVPKADIKNLLKSGLGQKILDYAESHPNIIKEYSEFLSDIVY